MVACASATSRPNSPLRYHQKPKLNSSDRPIHTSDHIAALFMVITCAPLRPCKNRSTASMMTTTTAKLPQSIGLPTEFIILLSSKKQQKKTATSEDVSRSY